MRILKEILVAFFGLGGLLSVLSFGGCKTFSWPDFFKTYCLMGIASTIFWVGNGFLSDWLSRYFSWTDNPARRFGISMLATVLYTFLGFIVVVWLWRVAYDGDWSVVAAVKNVGFKQFFGTLVFTIMVSAIMHGRGFLMEWKNTLLEAERLKNEHMTARFETLKNQVNPHFLFNSLNVLSSLVHKDADLAEKFIAQLSKVYRFVLETRDQETVPLKTELDNLASYIFMMKIRFGDSLRFENRLTEAETMHGFVAPLTLQMLVENALKHNETSKARPLSIEVFVEDDCVVVRNALQKKSNVLDSTGLGLDNIQARYAILSSKPVVIEEKAPFFTVKVPILTV